MVVLEQADVLVGKFLSIHLLHPVCEDASVESDEVLLRKLADEGGEVLLLDIGICIILAACCRILSLAVLDEEVKVIADFPVLTVSLAVKHE